MKILIHKINIDISKYLFNILSLDKVNVTNTYPFNPVKAIPSMK